MNLCFRICPSGVGGLQPASVQYPMSMIMRILGGREGPVRVERVERLGRSKLAGEQIDDFLGSRQSDGSPSHVGNEWIDYRKNSSGKRASSTPRGSAKKQKYMKNNQGQKSKAHNPYKVVFALLKKQFLFMSISSLNDFHFQGY